MQNLLLESEALLSHLLLSPNRHTPRVMLERFNRLNTSIMDNYELIDRIRGEKSKIINGLTEIRSEKEALEVASVIHEIV